MGNQQQKQQELPPVNRQGASESLLHENFRPLTDNIFSSDLRGIVLSYLFGCSFYLGVAASLLRLNDWLKLRRALDSLDNNNSLRDVMTAFCFNSSLSSMKSFHRCVRRMTFSHAEKLQALCALDAILAKFPSMFAEKPKIILQFGIDLDEEERTECFYFPCRYLEDITVHLQKVADLRIVHLPCILDLRFDEEALPCNAKPEITLINQSYIQELNLTYVGRDPKLWMKYINWVIPFIKGDVIEKMFVFAMLRILPDTCASNASATTRPEVEMEVFQRPEQCGMELDVFRGLKQFMLQVCYATSLHGCWNAASDDTLMIKSLLRKFFHTRRKFSIAPMEHANALKLLLSDQPTRSSCTICTDRDFPPE